MGSAFPCTECELHETALTVCIAPTTPESPRFAVVAEAPGAEEDQQGLPLVGPSGKLLWEEMGKHGLRREEALVTNVVKCRPPDNRTPKQREIKACRGYLNAELHWLRWATDCQYVLVLGAVAFKALGGTGKITEQQGCVYEHQGLKVFPCLHPSAVLRSKRNEEPFKHAIADFARLVSGKAPSTPQPEVVVIRDNAGLTRMVEDLADARWVAFDIEGTCLDEQHPMARLMSIAYCADPSKAYVVLLQHPECRGDVRAMMEVLSVFHGKRGWVAQNGKFDVRWIEHFGMRPPKLERDTIVMAHLIDENLPKNVEAVAARHLGLPAWGHLMKPHFDAIQKAIKKNEEIPYPPVEALAQYTALDVVVERMLADVLWEQLNDAQKSLHDHLLMPTSRTLASVERRGVWVDRAELEAKQVMCQREVKRAVLSFAKTSGKEAETIKLGSPQWLVQTLFSEMGLPVVELTANGAGSTNEHSMKRLRKHAPKAINAILHFRKHQKWLGSYLRPWEALLNTEGRLRSSYNLTGTVTGRLSCSNVSLFPGTRHGMSLHQVPRDGEIRAVVSAPPGRKLLVADYSQIELRVAAALAHEPRMIEAYRKGEDLHTLTASRVTGKPVEAITKEERTKAKAVNFGFLYGMGARHFTEYAFNEYGIEFTVQESESIRNAYFALYRGLRSWHQDVEDFVLRYGYVVSPLGRIRHLPDAFSPNKSLRYEAVRQAINSPVQATASDFTLAAMTIIDRQLQHRERLQAWVVGQVHDSILVECAEDTTDEVASMIHWAMQDRTPEYVEKKLGYKFPLPLEAEVAIGQRWGVPEKVLEVA